MQKRLPLVPELFGDAYRAMRGLSAVVKNSGLERSLLLLIKLRVSQLNGCGYCIDMHTKDARAAGESEQRLYLLQVWREAPIYTERECAALAWAEAVTRLDEGGVPDTVYDRVKASFSDAELVALTLAIIEINGWNRISISFNAVPGTYRVGEHDS
ncbi:MAG TPA: carboxymuconolactone decarboxylase family protein [Steroidobacteraceae bacterium]|jgi:AhpD family alkylhydroperoxidase